MRQRNILVTCGGGFQGLTLQKMFSTLSEVVVHVLDINQENIVRYFAHRFHLAQPLKDAESYISQIESICRDERIELVVPATALDLEILSENKQRLEGIGVRCAVSDPYLLGILLSKRKTYEWLAEYGLPVLPVIDWAKIADHLPVIGKPERSWGGRGIIVLRDESTLQELQQTVDSQALGDIVWQRWLPRFEEYSIDICIDFDQNPAPVLIRQRLHTSGGFATVIALEKAKPLTDIGTRIAHCFAKEGGCGFFNVQVLHESETGNYFISDMNPRIGTSAVGFAGIERENFFAKALLDGLATIGQGSYPSHKSGTRIVRFLEEKTFRPLRKEFDIQGVVLDLDDTLISTKLWTKEKLIGLYQQFEDVLPPLEAFLPRALFRFEEGHRKDLIDILIEDFGLSKPDRMALINAYRAAKPDVFLLKKDAQFLLEALSKTFKLALLTDNPRASQEQKINATGIAPFFNALIFTADIGENKPSKRTFEAASAALGIEPSKLLMIGDNLFRDIHGAREAGFAHSIWVQQPGSMFNFDASLYPELREFFTSVDSLLDIAFLLDALPTFDRFQAN